MCILMQIENKGIKEFLFNDTLNTFDLRLFRGLLFLIGERERTIYVPISTQDQNPALRSRVSGWVALNGVGGRGGGRELLTCPHPLKVQAYPPRDQRPALRSSVSGWVALNGGGGRTINMPTSTEDSDIPTTRPKACSPV